MSYQVVKSLFKFYRLNTKLLVGILGFFILLLVIASGLFVFNRVTQDNREEQITVVTTPNPDNSVTLSPEEKIQIATEGATFVMPSETQNKEMPKENSVTSTATSYTVQAGDTLWDISATYLQDAYKYGELAKINNISRPDHIEIGQVIVFETNLEAENANPSSYPTGTLEDGVSLDKMDTKLLETYTIQKGDTLWQIAATKLSNPILWTQVYKLNQKVIGLNPDLIYPGTVILLPVEATE